MLDLRDMELLAALARHRHFARAAEACGISQPAFSARIRNLERDLRVAIVNRGNRFQGFTPEGEIVLRWGRKMLADADGLRQEVSAATGSLKGALVIGVVPTALAFAAGLPALVAEQHPELRLELHSASSDQIRRGLQDFAFAAGITYLEGHGTEVRLYDEEYVLVTPEALMASDATSMTWAEAAALPLCLLSRAMQNRRILEAAFAEVGVVPDTRMETNALTVSWAQLRTGRMATILPRALLGEVPLPTGLRVLDLTEPTVRKPIGLVLPEREPVPPSHAVLRDLLTTLAR